MTRTKKHDNSKPCGKECPICYPINPRSARARRRELKAEERDEMKKEVK